MGNAYFSVYFFDTVQAAPVLEPAAE